ncbi:hypothetical protein FC701_17135 [Bacillus mycoides]|uniref:Uncharacterized protein n=1 Tax=Bacillus mycoides TaxID=1405 RepID=A0A4U3A659_BACMY|nr:hypothetical protein FC701_17135 [Bacillus mycoides]
MMCNYYTITVFNECLSYNGGESTHIIIRNGSQHIPLYFSRESTYWGECSLSFAPFSKDKHILKWRAGFRSLVSHFNTH